LSEDANSRAVGRVPFVDCVAREVYKGDDGNRSVVGDDGERVYGVWLMLADEAVVIEAPSPS
jgi:hypothetical protein